MNRRMWILLGVFVVIVLAMVARDWTYVLFASYEGTVMSTSATAANQDLRQLSKHTMVIETGTTAVSVPIDPASEKSLKVGDRVRKRMFQLKPRVLEKAKNPPQSS
jgi:hypothetical protein